MIIGYNMMTELSFIVMAAFMVGIMICTQPRSTEIYRIDFGGMVLSVFTIFAHILLVFMASYVSLYDTFIFDFICMIYLFMYSVVLCMITAYVEQLSPNGRKNRRRALYIKIGLVSVYLIIMSIIMLSGKMYVIDDGYIQFTRFFNIHLLFGIADAVYCLIIALKEKRYIAKIVFYGLVIFVPFEIIVLVLQFFVVMTIFSSVTYVLPFTIFYILFHGNPYNELIGCQNEYSFNTRFSVSMKRNKRFIIAHISVSKMYAEGIMDDEEQKQTIIIEKCRAAENAFKDIHIYSLENNQFAIYVGMKKDDNKDLYANIIKTILDEPVEYNGVKVTVSYKMTVLEKNEYIDDIAKLYSFLKYILRKYEQGISKQHYICTDDDYREFIERYNIEKLLMDIRNSRNQDDDRVLCYVQPIYSVKNDSFRTAEALMRLQDGDKIIYPDKFIPVAENIGCIHMLTCIMVNKVCKKINELDSRGYIFDAISVNCSTTELCEPDFYNEISDIIKNNNVDCRKIRLELTESTSVENYNAVYKNMEMLNTKGIRFYLDDFGTGYSNLERIVTFPFMTVKFDKSILYKAIDDENMNTIVESMVSVFKEKGMILLVEGVENEEHYEYSVEHGFDYIQGYKYAKPVPVEKLTEYFTQESNTIDNQ